MPGDIFGSSKKSSSKTGNVSMTQNSKVNLSPEQQRVFDLTFPSIEQYAGSTPQLYPGETIVDFTPAERRGMQFDAYEAEQMGKNLDQIFGTQSKLLDPNFMLNPNEYVQGASDAVTRQVTQNLNENILPQIRGESTMAGGPYSGGSTKTGIAEGQAVGRTNQELSDALAKMYLDNYQKGLSGMLTATQNNQNILASSVLPGQLLADVGGRERAMAQAKLDEAVRNFYTQQDLPLLKANNLLSLLQGMPGGSATTTVNGAFPMADPTLQALGLGLTGAGLAGQGGILNGLGSIGGSLLGSAFGPVGSLVGGTLGSGLGKAVSSIGSGIGSIFGK